MKPTLSNDPEDYIRFLADLDPNRLRRELDRVNANIILVCLRLENEVPGKALLRAFRKWRSRRACILVMLRGIRRSLRRSMRRDPDLEAVLSFVERLYRHAGVRCVPGGVSALGRIATAPPRP